MYVSQHFAPCVAMPEAKTNWREGVDLVNMFLKISEPSDTADLSEMLTDLDLAYAETLRKQRLHIDHSCKNTIREFNGYRAPQTRLLINPREAAQKYDDHALDAIRYGLMHIFKLGCGASSLADVYDPRGMVWGSRAVSAVTGMTTFEGSTPGGAGFFTFPRSDGRFDDSGSFFNTSDLNF